MSSGVDFPLNVNSKHIMVINLESHACTMNGIVMTVGGVINTFNAVLMYTIL